MFESEDQLEFEFLKDKINLEGCKSLHELVRKNYLTEHKYKKYSKTPAECTAEQVRKNKIEKKLLYKILNKNEEIEIHINELRNEYRNILYEFKRQNIIKMNQNKRRIMLCELKIKETNRISDEELENLYENKKKLLAKIHKKGEDFLRECNKTQDTISFDIDNDNYDNYNNYDNDDNSENYDNYEYEENEINIMLHNPGGATIYTKSNAMGEMSFNIETGIYEQN